jgi:hypothetical protein
MGPKSIGVIGASSHGFQIRVQRFSLPSAPLPAVGPEKTPVYRARIARGVAHRP